MQIKATTEMLLVANMPQIESIECHWQFTNITITGN